MPYELILLGISYSRLVNFQCRPFKPILYWPITSCTMFGPTQLKWPIPKKISFMAFFIVFSFFLQVATSSLRAISTILNSKFVWLLILLGWRQVIVSRSGWVSFYCQNLAIGQSHSLNNFLHVQGLINRVINAFLIKHLDYLLLLTPFATLYLY